MGSYGERISHNYRARQNNIFVTLFVRYPYFAPPTPSAMTIYLLYIGFAPVLVNSMLNIKLPTRNTDTTVLTNLDLSRGRNVILGEAKNLKYEKVDWDKYLFCLPEVLFMAKL